MRSMPHILVVDDDEWIAENYARVLKKANYTVEYAANALEAMERLDQTPTNAIILDLFMPGPNGLVLLNEIASHSDLNKIPVIVITNAAHDIKEGALLPYGVAKVLDKTSMQPDDVLAAVRSVLP